eukprot:1469825-Rhodomonas_salina.2
MYGSIADVNGGGRRSTLRTRRTTRTRRWRSSRRWSRAWVRSTATGPPPRLRYQPTPLLRAVRYSRRVCGYQDHLAPAAVPDAAAAYDRERSGLRRPRSAYAPSTRCLLLAGA